MQIDPPSPLSPPSPRRFADTDPFASINRHVSILNFDKRAPEVVFTEPATIEALKRLGYSQNEFNFKPISCFYANSTVDNRSTAVVYQRYLSRRESMIDRVISMRKYLIDSEKQEMKISNNVRKAQMDYERSVQTLRNVQDKDRSTLKKLALAKLREMNIVKDDTISFQKNTVKFHDIDTYNNERQRFVDELRMTSGYRYQQSTLPSINTYTARNFQASVSSRRPTDSTWLTNGLNRFDKTRLNASLNADHVQNVRDRKAMIEREKLEATINYIQTKDERSDRWKGIVQDNQYQRIEARRNLMKKRAKSARITRDTIIENDAQRTYEAYCDARDSAKIRIQNLKEQQMERTLKRKLALEDKLTDMRHSFNANTHNRQVEMDKLIESNQGMDEFRKYEKEVNNMQRLEKLDFANAKYKLNQELNKLKDPETDKEGLARIAKAIGISKREMDDIVLEARISKDELKKTPRSPRLTSKSRK